MNDYRSRLIVEARDLKEKLDKLRAFNNGENTDNISKEDKQLLLDQQDIMKKYHDILETRLARS